VRPTALGVKAAFFFGVLVVAFLATPYSNLFFLLLAFLTVLAFLSLWWTARALRGFAPAPLALAPTPAGIGARISADLGAGRRDRLGLTVELELGPKQTLFLPAPMLSGETEWSACLPAMERGVYSIRSAHAATTWPMGLFRVRVPLPCADSIVVYPRPFGDADATGGGADDMGIGVAAAGAAQPAGLREYRAGDDPRRIHWKASARRGAPILQEWGSGRGSGFEIVLDRRQADGFEEALSIIVSAAQLAREAKETLTLHTQGLSKTYGSDQQPWDGLLHVLAGAEPLDAGGPPPPPAPPEAVRLPRPEAPR